jgi:hypothetical protein
LDAKEAGMKRLLSVLMLLGVLVAPVLAGNIPLAWDASTSSGVTGYKIYYGSATGVYPNVKVVGNVTTYTLTGLVDGSYFIVATAFDANGNESAYSNEVSTVLKTINPPGNMKRVVPTTATLFIPVPDGKEAKVALRYDDKVPKK